MHGQCEGKTGWDCVCTNDSAPSTTTKDAKESVAEETTGLVITLNPILLTFHNQGSVKISVFSTNAQVRQAYFFNGFGADLSSRRLPLCCVLKENLSFLPIFFSFFTDFY